MTQKASSAPRSELRRDQLRSLAYTVALFAVVGFLIWAGEVTDQVSWIVLGGAVMFALVFGIVHALRHIDEGEDDCG
jgi:hypothetical protein